MSLCTRLLAVALTAALAGAGCGAERNAVPPASAQADQFLFERGAAAFKERKWLQAREYYRQIVDNYPQSPYRPDAKLAVGDTYIGEHSVEALMLGVNEFREFLTFYPTSTRADYAQYRLATALAEQMLAPERDQHGKRPLLTHDPRQKLLHSPVLSPPRAGHCPEH